MTLRHKYTLSSLLKRFSIPRQDLEDLIDEGLLLPDHWLLFSDEERYHIKMNDFDGILWDVIELERFERILRIIQRNYDLFTNRILVQVNDVHDVIDSIKDQSSKRQNQILYELARLRHHIDKKDIYIDLDYFKDLTGYKDSTVYNAIEKIDDLSMYLKFDYYKNLTWTRRIKNGKWKLRLIDLEDTRKNLPYELRLIEDQRTGRKDKRIGGSPVDII